MRAVPMISGQEVFSGFKNAVFGTQAVVAGRLATVLPVTEHDVEAVAALSKESLPDR